MPSIAPLADSQSSVTVHISRRGTDQEHTAVIDLHSLAPGTARVMLGAGGMLPLDVLLCF